MRLVLQRVEEASVTVGAQVVSRIGPGLVVLVGVARGDGSGDVRRAADKVARLRLFEDHAGKMNLALGDVGGAVLAVSQFTLVGSIDRGRRPGFDGAMAADDARTLFDAFVGAVAAHGPRVETGSFGAHMKLRLVNDGPVTFVFDTRRRAA